MGLKVAAGNGSSVFLVLGLDPFPRPASPSQDEGESFGQHAEVRLLNECVREAFWSRVMPLSGCLALAFRQAARMRLIASHPTFGVPLRFWALGALIGFEGGCALYGDSCANKAVARLPNSKLAANILRCRNQIPADNLSTFEMSSFNNTEGIRILKLSSGDNMVGTSNDGTTTKYSDEIPSSQWDWQIFSPAPEETVGQDCDVEQGPSNFTYAELRQRNRGTIRGEVMTSRPMSIYDKLRQRNRATLTEEHMCQRKEN